MDNMEAYIGNKHYININEKNLITGGWSNGPHNNRQPKDTDICINEKGGYQFRLIIDGKETEENPPLYEGMSMIPLYKWDGSHVLRRSEQELEADRAAWKAEQARIAALPTREDKIEAQITYTAMMTDTMLEG